MPRVDSTFLSEVPVACLTNRCGPGVDLSCSNSWDGPTINGVLRAGNGSRSRRDEESNELRDFLRLGGAAERNAAEALHDDLLAALIVRTGLGREALCQCDRRLGFDPPGRNAD